MFHVVKCLLVCNSKLMLCISSCDKQLKSVCLCVCGKSFLFSLEHSKHSWLDVSRVFQGCLKVVSKVSQSRVLKGVLRVFKGCSMGVLKMFWGFLHLMSCLYCYKLPISYQSHAKFNKTWTDWFKTCFMLLDKKLVRK